MTRAPGSEAWRVRRGARDAAGAEEASVVLAVVAVGVSVAAETDRVLKRWPSGARRCNPRWRT